MTDQQEKTIQGQIRLAAAERGYTLWRNNTGVAWQGSLDRAPPIYRGGVLLREARRIRFGLCNGSSDLIGLRSVTITEDMVGQDVAVFVAFEVKKKKKSVTPLEQENFVRFIRKAGGIGEIVRGVEEIPE